MENQETVLAEYDTLRQGIIQGIQMNLQAAAVTLPVAGAVIAYGSQAAP